MYYRYCQGELGKSTKIHVVSIYTMWYISGDVTYDITRYLEEGWYCWNADVNQVNWRFLVGVITSDHRQRVEESIGEKVLT